MTISVILRLTIPALREGRLAGQAEIVANGTRLMIRDAAELIDAVREYADGPGHDPDVVEPASPQRSSGSDR